jgi:indolepyruvate ferredoxin oxidoreductase beta subunit
MTTGNPLEAQPTAQPAQKLQPAEQPTNVLIVGVGGQGVIMISKVLATLCQQQDLDVKQSEVHGMSKRGGSVFSHLRFGTSVYSPTIPMGQADVLVALEWAEGLRWLPYLNPETGTFLADTQQVIPPFACRSRKPGAVRNYVQHSVVEIAAKIPNCFATDAGRMAGELGNARAGNTVLLGMLSTALDFPVAEWHRVIEQMVPPKTIQLNLQAFELGRNWVAKHDPERTRQVESTAADYAEQTADDVMLRNPPVITAAWCKSCAICVQFCPERCLKLNENQIAELTDPDLCTRCCVCERLCPDFAITITRVNPV